MSFINLNATQLDKNNCFDYRYLIRTTIKISKYLTTNKINTLVRNYIKNYKRHYIIFCHFFW